MSLEEEQARQRAANDNPSTAPETNTAESAAGSLVPPDAPPQAGTAGEHTDANENAQHENDMLQQALALSRGENEQMDTEPEQPRATVAGMNEGDQDEEMTEEEAIARAIEMSLMESRGEQSNTK